MVKPGDHMSASVTFTGTAKYTLVLTDTTRHWTHTIVKRNATFARSSAEVITEAPSSNDRRVLPLANFGTVRFSLVRINGLVLSKETPSRIVMVRTAAGLPQDSTSVLGNAGGRVQQHLDPGQLIRGPPGPATVTVAGPARGKREPHRLRSRHARERL